MSDFSLALALQLRLHREHAQMSQQQLAESMNVHRNTIFKWERGEGQMPTIAFLRFCVVVKADAGEVLKRILIDKQNLKGVS